MKELLFEPRGDATDLVEGDVLRAFATSLCDGGAILLLVTRKGLRHVADNAHNRRVAAVPIESLPPLTDSAQALLVLVGLHRDAQDGLVVSSVVIDAEQRAYLFQRGDQVVVLPADDATTAAIETIPVAIIVKSSKSLGLIRSDYGC
ncbi:hypothetical protein [Massilia sp. YMA4]|uniref:hypothetical protein n=1 Tax=Massilia sp. YMA4 TaxID=1593482 RepID=UPI000DD1441A|nr:hypothetical protein [Massilia sp. YMA4]AXA89715.1 hypothetical protein DPH57_00090 [Massilia sp. YMA4]